MITVDHLVKRYGAHVAVDDLSFGVERGEVVGFLGPNGAGKSTTLRVLAGFLGPTSGKVTVAGHDIVEDSFAARASIGYMPEAVPLYQDMRVAEYLAFRAELKRVPRKQRKAHVDDAMERAHVSHVATVLIGKLSKGFRQRVGLADALVAKPSLLILDEPTAGLDPNEIREVRDLLRDLGKEHTVLLSTHILSEVEAACSRVLVIARGRLVAQGTLDEIHARRRPLGLELLLRGDEDDVRRALTESPGLAAYASDAGKPALTKVRVESRGELLAVSAGWARHVSAADIESATEELVRALVSASIGVREVKDVGNRLEEVFAELTASANAGREAGDA